MLMNAVMGTEVSLVYVGRIVDGVYPLQLFLNVYILNQQGSIVVRRRVYNVVS